MPKKDDKAKSRDPWFKHDQNSRNDPKLIKIRRQMTFEGIGLYWSLIEVLRGQSDYTLPFGQLEEIAYDFQVTPSLLERVVKDFGLFHIERGKFKSIRLSRDMEALDERRRKLSEAGKAGNEVKYGKNSSTNGDNLASPQVSGGDQVATTDSSPGDQEAIAIREEERREEEKRERVEQMLAVWKSEVPGYIVCEAEDSPALEEIRAQIAKSLSPPEFSTEESFLDVRKRWCDLIPKIRKNKHFREFDLPSLAKTFQKVLNQFPNETIKESERKAELRNPEDQSGAAETAIEDVKRKLRQGSPA